jgi:hypothetical protein
VLRYASDFIPSWAGAISIDLMPAVLVLILCVVHAAIRREGAPVANADTLTAADLITALRLARTVDSMRTGNAETAQSVEAHGPDAPADNFAERSPSDENVRPLPALVASKD